MGPTGTNTTDIHNSNCNTRERRAGLMEFATSSEMAPN